MPVPSHLLKNLRSNLSSVLANVYSQRQLDELVLLCHSLAVSSIRGKLASGKINTSLLGLNDSDLAYDCIADLFQRDEKGIVLHLKTYFESFSIESASDELLLAHIRRLIFARVNQGLFRLYNEADPALGKILRNIKLAIHSLGNFIEIERFGESYISPSLCDPLHELPEIEGEGLQRLIRQVHNGNERIPEMLAKLSLSLRRQQEYSRAVRLMDIAYAIRSIFGEMQTQNQQEPVAKQALLMGDAMTAINESCREVEEKNFRKYVGKKKVSPQNFENYFLVIEGKLKEIFVGHDGEDSSLYDQLRQLLPMLTKEEYKRKHKNILEYLSRITYKRAIEKLKRE
jgi:hypothetical protein